MTELETLHRAKLYMDKLAQGIDPVTDREISEETVLNHVRLARCFFYISGILQKVIDNGGEVGYYAKRRRDFAITPQQLQQVRPAPYSVRITEFTKQLHQVVGDPEMKQMNATKFTDWLVSKGFLISETAPDGKTRRIPTEAGARLGIHTKEHQGQYGSYLATLYDPNAQQFLLDHFWEIAGKK